jgi:hypothetical protein
MRPASAYAWRYTAWLLGVGLGTFDDLIEALDALRGARRAMDLRHEGEVRCEVVGLREGVRS